MWQRLSILMVLLLTFVELGTLGLVNWFDIKERQTIATEQAETLSRSLNNDLLSALLNTNADILPNINFRIEGFKSVDAIQLFNKQDLAIYSYCEGLYIADDLYRKLKLDIPYFVRSSDNCY